MSELSPEHWQDIAAMNARTYAMSEEDRAAWYADHPVSAFTYPEDGTLPSTLAHRARNRAAESAADAAECITLGRYDDARGLLAEAGRHLDRAEKYEGKQREEAPQ